MNGPDGNKLAVDTAIIGAGIAGASLACELLRQSAGRQRVALLEAESHPGYHTTGRSSAMYTRTYGNAATPRPDGRQLGFSSARRQPGSATRRCSLPAGSCTSPTLNKSPLSRPTMLPAASWRPIYGCSTVPKPQAMVPVLRPGWAVLAAFEPTAMAMDVAAIHGGYLRAARAMGGTLVANARTIDITKTGKRWALATTAGNITADVVVNAAGAWADEVAVMADLPPLGLVPKRRTAIIFPSPANVDLERCPIVIDGAEDFYFKPEPGRILASPADATPSPPCDAQPEAIDVAILVDRLQRATTLAIERINSQWAGLRSFFPDETPVNGFDAAAPGFYWLAGQGGYGITTCDAMARIAVAGILGQPFPADLAALGLSAETLSPARSFAPSTVTLETENTPR